ncbi:hypothetical protein Pint_22553 [Pistacia integerrima]|uniref:Uncharacterized protein n=1 Tax=Pistacia integerrima TaxID=434235 RepID=A0ACC0YM87_9ROSI|nr:hypothetical protein Pint_22553 [Pistacia integerrima]
MAEETEFQKGEEGTGTEMKPWEQHSRVISIPRFDYNAPSSILQRSHSGFLITCTIKREKSATKEAITILQKYIASYYSDGSGSVKNSDTNGDAKRRKTCTDEASEEFANGAESGGTKEDPGGLPKDDCSSHSKVDTNTEYDFDMSLVKLKRSGLLLLTFPRENSYNIVGVVSNIVQSLDSGTLKSPLWCHRIFPIQSTCILKEVDLQATVSKLVLQFMNDKQNKLSRPVKVKVYLLFTAQLRIHFAVGYNRRGFDETQMKTTKDTLNDSNLFAMLDRNKCFNVVAAAVKDVVSDSEVDLKFPELSILVELLPLAVPATEPLVVAVSVLPHNLVTTKPRLCIRALVSLTNAKNEKTRNKSHL